MVGPWQLYGIEKNQYACELAQVSIWIGHLQWQRANGYRTFTEPILHRMTNFECKDAILDLRDPEKPVEPNWPEVEFVVGNPPFLGGKKLKTELGEPYVNKLFYIWKNRVRKESDLCCYWFEKARKQIELGKCKRAGLLATQGIRGGANRVSLKCIKGTGDIFFAESDRDWILDGANVHVSMVGFDDGKESARVLDGAPVEWINPNLTTGPDVTKAHRLKDNLHIAFMGDTKGGKFDLKRVDALRLLESPNPNGRPSSDVITPWINGKDVTGRNRDIWIIDFGLGPDESELELDEDPSHYEGAFEYVRRVVHPKRANNKRKSYKIKWWIHVEPRPAMREALFGLTRFIVTPIVSKHRLFAWEQAPTMPDHQLIVFATSNDYVFGLLHSRPHEVWARAQGTQVRERESGFRYTPTTCFETFPFPGASEEQRTRVANAARKLNELRNNWLNPADFMRTDIIEFPGSLGGPWGRYVHEADERGVGTVRYPRRVARDSLAAKTLAKRTLTNLYNSWPVWLVNVHRELDEAVCAAYGWESSISDMDILEKLLALNLEREEAQAQAAKAEADDEESSDEDEDHEDEE